MIEYVSTNGFMGRKIGNCVWIYESNTGKFRYHTSSSNLTSVSEFKDFVDNYHRLEEMLEKAIKGGMLDD